MKKIGFLLLLTLLPLLLFGCNQKVDHTVIINKYFESTSMVNSAIELYNAGQKEVKLNDYTLDIYPNGQKNVGYSIKLTGSLKEHDYYLITSNSATDIVLKEQADLKSADLLFNGNDAIALSYKGTVIDSVGKIGQAIDFGKDLTLIRKDSNKQPSSEFQAYHFMTYLPGVFEYVKNENHPVKTNKQLLDGPRLTDEFRNLPFSDPNNPSLGGGGTIEVTLESVADGDTATFMTLDGKASYRVRFFYIDTREVQGTGSPNGQPWGYPASAFTKDILNQAKLQHKKIEIQTIKGNSLFDGYDRLLALVWVDGQLVNFMVVRAGLSDVNAINPSKDMAEMAYQHIAYYSYLQNAWERAQIYEWGIFTVDPQWNYETGRPILPIENIPNPRLYDSNIDE